MNSTHVSYRLPTLTCCRQRFRKAAACLHCGAPVKKSLLGQEMDSATEAKGVAAVSSEGPPVKTQEAQGPVEKMPYGEKIFRICGHVGDEKKVKPGSFGMEIVLLYALCSQSFEVSGS